MQIHELSTLSGNPASGTYLMVDNGTASRKLDYTKLAQAIIEQYNGSTIAGSKQTVQSSVNALYDVIGQVNVPAFHNSIYRGKNLGTSWTAAMSTAVSNGTFSDMFVGDYLTINNTVYRIAGFNLIKNVGDTNMSSNNVCFVPDSLLYSAQMHNTDSGAYESGAANNTTEGAYVNSDMRTTNLAQATQKILNDFGSSHVIQYRDYLTNATADGQASGAAWTDCQVELMSEVMVYGTKVWGNSGYEVGGINFQLPLFRLNPEMIHRRSYYWLRSVRSATHFADVSNYSYARYDSASYSFGVRPLFFVR